MKPTFKKSKKGKSLREKILKSLMASFKIEGIDIPLNVAEKKLKKVELNLGK
jgi:predicted nuclease with RNAse H fold